MARRCLSSLPRLDRRRVPAVGPRVELWEERVGRRGTLLSLYAHTRTGNMLQPAKDDIGAVSCREVKFPKPRGLYVNMMPFVVGDAASVPLDLRHYLPLLAACPISRGEWGQVGYLTIDERPVKTAGTSQRRPGIHVESVLLTADAAWRPMDWMPKTLLWGQGQVLESSSGDDDDEPQCGHLEGGLFMATNLDASCRVWNRRVDPRLVGSQDLEARRPFLGDGYAVKANELVWITDQTPHESCVLPAASPRQFFRFVTSKVDVWYARHSTPNPLGVKVPSHVQIVHDDKFFFKMKPDRSTRQQQLQVAAQAASDAAEEHKQRIMAAISKKRCPGPFATFLNKLGQPRKRPLMAMESPFDDTVKAFPDYDENEPTYNRIRLLLSYLEF